ncbi:MAG: beta-ketoacyl-[acyl-carrier-protein] synthase family protein [Burkholderiaceae bacterium]
MRRVAVTGIGIVAPLGINRQAFFDTLIAGKSGVRRLDAQFCERLAAPIAACVDFKGEDYFDAPKLRMLDRVSQFALVAAREALADADLALAGEDREKVGVAIGTGMGGAHTLDDGYRTLYAEGSDRLKPFTVLTAMVNAAASWIANEYALNGPNLTYSTACSSSAVALGEACGKIRSGEAEVMLAGGSEAPLSFGTLKAWEALRTLANEDPIDPAASCKPFSARRSGLVLGEGAALFVLEEWERAQARGASIYAALSGYGLYTDCAHLTRPTVAGQAQAMRRALVSAGIPPEAVEYINAHGTGTLANDAVETAAIKEVFGPHALTLPVSSTKGAHGHLLGAAGALELAAAILAMKESVLPPTLHLHEPDPECDLDYVTLAARRHPGLRTVMSNSFAFGGTNAVLIAQAP